MTTLMRLKDAGERCGYHPAHVYKLATDPAYAHVGFPKLVRSGKNSIALVESEVEAWIQARIAERDEKGYTPKHGNPRDNLPKHLRNTDPRKIRDRRAKERQLAGASA